MLFKGTFAIRHFKALEHSREKLIRKQRDAFQRTYWHALGLAVLDYGLHIPVLTGDTRKGVLAILKEIEMRLKKVGGAADFSPLLDVDTMTLAKQTQDDYPQPGDRPYRGAVQWPPGSVGGTPVKSRSEWRGAVKEHGHYPSNEPGTTFEFVPTGNAYVGYWTTYFSHGAAYWLEYDQDGLGGHGPWHLIELFDHDVRIYLDTGVRNTANKFAEVIAGFEGASHIEIAETTSPLAGGQASALKAAGRQLKGRPIARFEVAFQGRMNMNEGSF